MSLDELVKGDMGARIGRFAHVCSATCIVDHVAPPARPERHAELSMSPHPIARSDMHRRPCRSTRSCGATCEAEHVAPPNCMERHERLGIMETPASWREIL